MRTIIFLAFFILSVEAYDMRPPCYVDLERNFFDAGAVTQAMSMQMVSQGAWQPTVTELMQAQRELESIVNQKARRMNPNPFDPVFIPNVAKQLLLSSAWDMFYRVVYYQGFTKPDGIRTMFDYVVSQNYIKLKHCFPEPKQK
jgi:hypothetical protein